MIYANGKIYVIFSNSKKLYYIGSTTQTLSQRLAKHNSCFKSFKNGKCNYVTSFDILACDDYQIKLIEDCSCSNNKQLQKREGELIKTYTIDGFECVNKNVAGRTLQEWRTDNKDTLAEYQKQYSADNKDRLVERNKQYRETHKEQKKQYNATHREQINARQRAYIALKRKLAKSALASVKVVLNENE